MRVGLRSPGNAVKRLMLSALLLGVTAADTGAQEPGMDCAVILAGYDFVGPAPDLARVLDVLGSGSEHSFLIRRASDRYDSDACALPRGLAGLARSLNVAALPSRGATLLPVDGRFGLNSGYPRDWNDGVLWNGVGLGATATAGAAFRWGILEAALAPVLGLHQNDTFRFLPYPDTASYSRYIHRWHGRYIDLPQRFGNDGVVIRDLGQSYLRVQTRGFRAGLSNENLAWGPARRNPLLLSGTAAGFPHLFLETGRSHDVGIGDAELQVFWGRLQESAYFDHVPGNDRRALAGSVAALRPRGLEGLYLGAGYLHMQNWPTGTSAADLILGPWTGLGPDSSGLPRDLRLYAMFFRWASAPGGFEVYGEWARQDSWKEWFRPLNRVETPQAYTIGAQRTVRSGASAFRLSAEISHVSDNLAVPALGRGMHTFYVSPHVPQGHTHRGQLLGAPIGPGSEAQFIGADLFWKYGRSSLSIERARYDDDAFYAVWAQNHAPHGHDTELSFRAGHLSGHGAFTVGAEAGYSFRYSRSLLGLHHVNSPDFPYRRDVNYQLSIYGRFQPPAPSATER